MESSVKVKWAILSLKFFPLNRVFARVVATYYIRLSRANMSQKMRDNTIFVFRNAELTTRDIIHAVWMEYTMESGGKAAWEA